MSVPLSKEVNIKAMEVKLLEALEELHDIRAYDKVKEKVEAELRAGEYMSLEEYRARDTEKLGEVICRGTGKVRFGLMDFWINGSMGFET
ncbi:MAG: hypothetical protein ACE5IR_12450 [bacterium]